MYIYIYTQYIYICLAFQSLDGGSKDTGPGRQQNTGFFLLLLWDEHVGFLHSKMFNKNIGIL